MSKEPSGVPPTYVRLEVRTSRGWEIMHHGIRLLDPARYVERLAEKGKIARAVSLDGPEIWGPDEDDLPETPPTCPICEEPHEGPYTGECLI